MSADEELEVYSTVSAQDESYPQPPEEKVSPLVQVPMIGTNYARVMCLPPFGSFMRRTRIGLIHVFTYTRPS